MEMKNTKELKSKKYQIESTIEDLMYSKVAAYYYTDTRKQWDKDIRAAKKQLAKINSSIEKLSN